MCCGTTHDIISWILSPFSRRANAKALKQETARRQGDILARGGRMNDSPFGQAIATRKEAEALMRAGREAYANGVGSSGTSPVEDGTGNWARVIWEISDPVSVFDTMIYRPGETGRDPTTGGWLYGQDTILKRWSKMPDLHEEGTPERVIPVDGPLIEDEPQYPEPIELRRRETLPAIYGEDMADHADQITLARQNAAMIRKLLTEGREWMQSHPEANVQDYRLRQHWAATIKGWDTAQCAIAMTRLGIEFVDRKKS